MDSNKPVWTQRMINEIEIDTDKLLLKMKRNSKKLPLAEDDDWTGWTDALDASDNKKALSEDKA